MECSEGKCFFSVKMTVDCSLVLTRSTQLPKLAGLQHMAIDKVIQGHFTLASLLSILQQCMEVVKKGDQVEKVMGGGCRVGRIIECHNIIQSYSPALHLHDIIIHIRLQSLEYTHLL